MVQNFADKSATMKIRTMNFLIFSCSAYYGLLVCVVSLELSLERRHDINFLLKGWEATPQSFVPMKISCYTGIF